MVCPFQGHDTVRESLVIYNLLLASDLFSILPAMADLTPQNKFNRTQTKCVVGLSVPLRGTRMRNTYKRGTSAVRG